MAKKKKKTGRPKQKMGRPELLTQELQDTIVNYILHGAYVETAAKACGINKKTYYAWLHRGAEDKRQGRNTKYANFCNAVSKAVGESEMRDISMLDAWVHGREAKVNKITGQVERPEIKPVWQAVAWRLERKYQDRWGRKQEVEIKETTHKRLVDLITGAASLEDGKDSDDDFDIDAED